MNKFRNNLSLTLAALAMLLVSMLFVAGCGGNKSQQSASSYKVVDDQGVEVDLIKANQDSQHDSQHR